MASSVSQRERWDKEFAVLATRDPEVFFEAMLISLRENTIEPLDNKRINAQKLIFKRWFTLYERSLRREIAGDTKAMSDVFDIGVRTGKLRLLRSIPVKRTLFGKRLNTKAVAALITELEDHA